MKQALLEEQGGSDSQDDDEWGDGGAGADIGPDTGDKHKFSAWSKSYNDSDRGGTDGAGVAPLGIAQQHLLKRMREELPGSLAQMRSNGRKVGHWAWWAFPTELEGLAEPGKPTCVTRATAATLLLRAPEVWRDVLECVCELAEKDGKRALPLIDHGRVGYFIRFWEQEEGNPLWMQEVLERLKPVFGKCR
jgi:hypothetical protein